MQLNNFPQVNLLLLAKKKGHGVNLVTSADLAIERYFKTEIKRKFPSHIIVTEESQIPKLLPHQQDVWIIDPIDGTTVATFGIPHYCISLAYVKNGQVDSGAVLELPTGKLYWAQKDHGAFVGHTKLMITSHPLKGALTSSGLNYQWRDFSQDHKIIAKLYQAGATMVMLGSATLQSAYVAENRLTLFYEHGLKPWDIAAVKLIIEEAGGVATGFTEELDIFNPQTFVCGSKLAVKEFKQLLTSFKLH